MPTLHLSFSGLCTFVLDPPLDTFVFEPNLRKPGAPLEAPLKKATVLLQRLTRSRLLANQVNLRPEVLDQHFPLLEFNLDDYAEESTRRSNFHCFPTRDEEGRPTSTMTKGICLLNGEDLTIVCDGKNGAPESLQFSRLLPANPADPELNDVERESLFWMATLEDARPGKAAINPTLLTAPPASNQPILARVQLTDGWLKTRDLTDFPYTIAAAENSASLNRRVATSFEVEMTFKEKVTFSMMVNRNGEPTREQLVLTPKNGGDLQVGISNMEIDRFVGMDPASAPRVQADFEVYFDLLQEPIAQGLPRPFLQLAARDNSSTQGGISSCAPAGGKPPGGS